MMRALVVVAVLVVLASGAWALARAQSTAPPGGLEVVGPLALDRTSVAIGETISASVTYRNVTAAELAIRDIVVAGRPPGGSNLGGPWLDFRPGHGPATLPPGGEVTLRASRTIAPSDPPGAWYSFSTFQDAEGTWRDAPEGLNVAFTVTATAAVAEARWAPTFTSYYVAPTGDDANPGTLEAPLGTVQAGLDRLSPGDTLYLRGGVYTPPATLRLPRTGLPDVPIAVRGQPGELAIIDGRGVLTAGLELRDRAWITVDNLTIRNIGGRNGNGLVAVASTDLRLENITVTDATDSGIRLANTTRRIAVVNCAVSGSATGVQISGQEILVDGCRVHNNWRMIDDGLDCDPDPRTGGDHGGQAFAVNRTPGPVEIRNSEAWENAAPSTCYKVDGAFVELFFSQNVNIHHNRSRANVVSIEAAGDASGVRFWRNETRDEQFLAAHQASGMTVVNNTIWNTRPEIEVMIWVGSGNLFGDGSTAGFVFQNNILATSRFVFQLGRAWDAGAVVDRNVYHALAAGQRFGLVARRGATSLEGWRGLSGGDASSLPADPRVADAAVGDYRLRPDSPAVDRGAPVPPVTDGFTGAGPDIGRWERD